jgi:hypothetical protein
MNIHKVIEKATQDSWSPHRDIAEAALQKHYDKNFMLAVKALAP